MAVLPGCVTHGGMRDCDVVKKVDGAGAACVGVAVGVGAASSCFAHAFL